MIENTRTTEDLLLQFALGKGQAFAPALTVLFPLSEFRFSILKLRPLSSWTGLIATYQGALLVTCLIMLSRGNSDAGTRLRRAKSASSVQQRRAQPLPAEPIDPHIAHVHALVAAHRAMERSSERASEEMRRADSNASRNTQRTTPRSQNIRFHDTTEFRNKRPFLQSRTSNIACTLRIPSENTAIDDHTSSYGTTENYGAEPSSYRRLRKARSMLTPRKQMMSPAPPPYPTPMSTGSGPALRKVKSTIGTEAQGLKLGLKKSMSFIRHRARSLQRPHTEMAHREEAVAMAREQFLRDQTDPHAAPHPDSSFRLKLKRSRIGFPKTVRTNRETELGDGIRSENQPLFELQSEFKIRSISMSLRDKVKKVFGRSISNKEDFGAQQVEASRPHFRDYVNGSADAGLDTYDACDPESLARGSLYIPTQQYDETSEDLDKISTTLRSTASRESLHSSNRSRVTSWTNSNATASVVGRGTPLERKRLSIIKEDGGPHQPSSSAGHHLGGVSSFAEPIQRQDSRGQPIPMPDSQRIYSALLRRIDAEQAEMDRTKAQLSAIHQEQNINDDIELHKGPTIRVVQSEASLRTMAPDQNYRDFSISSEALREQCMTPQQIARHDAEKEKCRANLAVQDAQSSFFPFSNEQKPKAPSPYKLALAAQREQQITEADDGADEAETDTGSVVIHRRPTISRKLQGKFGMSSESVYSRTTCGGSNSLYHSPVASPEQSTVDLTGATGMATIIPTRINRYPRPVNSVRHLNRARSSEKGDWKGWIENQMSSLDRKAGKVSKASNRSHFREKAQIDGDDTSVGSDVGVRLGFGQRDLNETTPTAAPRSHSALNQRFPLLELKEVPRNNTPAPRSSDSITRSWSGVLNKSGSAERNDENRKLGARAVDSLRKISPKSISHMLTEKKSLMFGKKETVKAGSESPPISTPGRMHMQMSKTRKNETSSTSSEPGLSEATPTGNRVRMNQDKKYAFDDFKESQKDLSRLSRPFDMAVPEHNRPFDSMYLGKEDIGAQTGLGPGRLSVAPTKTMIGENPSKSADFWQRMGTLNDGADESHNSSPYSDTALPPVVNVQDVSSRTAKSGMSAGSSRLVSNFLRSRRRGNATDRNATEGSTAAFL